MVIDLGTVSKLPAFTLWGMQVAGVTSRVVRVHDAHCESNRSHARK